MTSDSFRNRLLKDSIDWKFLPPAAPHFGGLWEAGVKSVKHHLRRVLGASTPTVEEFSTLLCNIESCLNSRPLAPLKDDIDSFDALTPGHFLIGTALKSIPMPSVFDKPENRLNRWTLMRQKYEQFWRLWSQDYLHTLQQRTKWRERRPNLRPNDLVLVKEATLPPAKWHLGRVIECFPDGEGLVRAVRIRTESTTLIRPITQLCKLPVSNSVNGEPCDERSAKHDDQNKQE
nr:PREDICTED: uncharacterized protein LOC105663788 [Megachile rotundata]